MGYQDANRDAIGTIQRRFVSAVLSCACSAGLVRALARPAAAGEFGLSLSELLGLRFEQLIMACVCCFLLTASLFVGPIVQHWLGVAAGYEEVFRLPGGPWITARNLVLAPITEEFVFRACVVRLWVSASFSKPVIVFCSPFCFALAHAHHFIEHVRRTGNKKQALLQVAFQVFYTSLFGMYSNFLLLRTGSTLAVILAHTFCNHLGFPDLNFLVSKQDPLHRHRTWLGSLYLAGIVAFSMLIAPMTSGFASEFGGLAGLTA